MNTLDKIAVRRRELENELAKLHEQEEAIREKMKYLSADEVRRLLAEFNDPNGRMALEKFHDALKTLEYLRPMPTGSAGFGEVLFTWKSEENRDWEVHVDKRDGEVFLIYHGESMSFDLTPEQAGEVGRWLLGAAEVGQKIEDES